MSSLESDEKKIAESIYEEFVVVDQNKLELQTQDHDVPIKVCTEVGSFTLAVVKRSSVLRFEFEDQGALCEFHLLVYADVVVADPNQTNADQFVKHFGDISDQQIQNGFQQIKLTTTQPTNPIRQLISNECKGFELDGGLSADKKRFVVTFRILKKRDTFPNYTIQGPYRDLKIVVSGRTFFVSKELLAWFGKPTSDESKGNYLEQFARDVCNSAQKDQGQPLKVEEYLRLSQHLRTSARSPADVFHDFLLTVLNPSVLPNRENLTDLWILADALCVEILLDKCKQSLKLAIEMEIGERFQLAAQMDMHKLKAKLAKDVRTTSNAEQIDQFMMDAYPKFQ